MLKEVCNSCISQKIMRASFCICKTFKLVSKQWLKIICFVSIASGSPQGVQTKEDQRRLSGEAKCGELIQSFYIILLTNKLFAWRKNYKVFTVQRVFEDVSRAGEMWKVGLMSSFSRSPGFPICFFSSSKVACLFFFCFEGKISNLHSDGKQGFLTILGKHFVLEDCLLCLWGHFCDLDEIYRLYSSLRSFKRSSITFQIMTLCNSLRVSSESVFCCKQNRTTLSNRSVIGVLSSSLCF